MARVAGGGDADEAWRKGVAALLALSRILIELLAVFLSLLSGVGVSRARARSLAYLLTTGRTGAFKCFRLCLKDSILPPSRRSHYAPSSWPARGSYKTPIRKPSLKGLTTLCPSFLFLFFFPFFLSFFFEGCNSRETRDPPSWRWN